MGIIVKRAVKAKAKPAQTARPHIERMGNENEKQGVKWWATKDLNLVKSSPALTL